MGADFFLVPRAYELAARSLASISRNAQFELSVLADTQSLMQRETLKVLMARAA